MAEEKGDTEFGVEGPGGTRAYVKGKSPVLLQVLSLFLLSLFFWWIVQQQEARATERARQISADMQKMQEATMLSKNQMERMTESFKALASSVDVNTYVSTMPQSEREKLDLRKPAKLYEMQR